jgi:hypothetical protein
MADCEIGGNTGAASVVSSRAYFTDATAIRTESGPVTVNCDVVTGTRGSSGVSKIARIVTESDTVTEPSRGPVES